MWLKRAINYYCLLVTKALEDPIAANCISIVHSQPWVVNPLTVSIWAEGKKYLVLDLRHVSPHLFKYKSQCKDISTAPQLLGEGYYLYTFDIKSAYHHVEILTAIGSTLSFNGHFRANQAILFLTYYCSLCLLHLTYSPKCWNPWLKKCRQENLHVFGWPPRWEFLQGSASTDAVAVRSDLTKWGFFVSVNKCVWEPFLIQTETKFLICLKIAYM